MVAINPFSYEQVTIIFIFLSILLGVLLFVRKNRGRFTIKLQNELIEIFDKLNINTGVIFRNYTRKVSIYEIIQTKKYCKKKGIKFFLSNNIKLSIKLGLDGTYIPA